jgi:hypothetical protein
MKGLSELIGSWKNIPMSFPATWRLSSGKLQQIPFLRKRFADNECGRAEWNQRLM